MFSSIKRFVKRLTQPKDAQLWIDALIETIPLCVITSNQQLVYSNEQFKQLLDHNNQHLKNSLSDFLLPQSKRILEQALQAYSYTSFEIQLETSTGNVLHCLITMSQIDGYDYFLIQVMDITKQKQRESSLYNLAYYDCLTQLPNRTYFNQYSRNLIARYQQQDKRFSILLIDIDTFKHFNDSYGHDFGDQVVQYCSSAFYNAIEQFESKSNNKVRLCSRLGGDEFVIISDIGDASDAEQFANILTQTFKEQTKIDQHWINVTVSIGISTFPIDGTSISSLMQAADLALYKAKEGGRNQYQFYEVNQTTEAAHYLEHEQAIRYFIDTSDFEVYFQPLVNVNTRNVIGAEVLFRGNFNRYNDLQIGGLIDAAERSGLIRQLGSLILQKACKACSYIRQHYDPTFVIAVNVSTQQLQQTDFANLVFNILEQYQLPPQALNIEVTETAVMDKFREGLDELYELIERGVKLSIDDFGQGYSSMTYLRHLPATQLKIDKEFVDDIATNETAKEIARGLTQMAQTLGLDTCAEGVEYEQQFDVISQLQVDVAQGFLLYKPMSEQHLMELLWKNN